MFLDSCFALAPVSLDGLSAFWRESQPVNDMKVFPTTRLCESIGSAIVLLVAGCNGLTPSAQTRHRISEKPDAFNALKVQQQEDILGGAIERGNTFDMVYLALGKPKQVMTSADGVKAMWVYVEYYAANAPFVLSFNNPGSYGSLTSLAGGNTPAHGGEGSNGPVDATMPKLNGIGQASAVPTPSLTPADMRSKTVYVFFFNGRVAEIKLDGDASDQQHPLNRLPKPKPKKENFFKRSIEGDIDSDP